MANKFVRFAITWILGYPAAVVAAILIYLVIALPLADLVKAPRAVWGLPMEFELASGILFFSTYGLVFVPVVGLIGLIAAKSRGERDYGRVGLRAALIGAGIEVALIGGWTIPLGLSEGVLGFLVVIAASALVLAGWAFAGYIGGQIFGAIDSLTRRPFE